MPCVIYRPLDWPQHWPIRPGTAGALDCQPLPTCNATKPLDHGRPGECTGRLQVDRSCEPSCEDGYLLVGHRSCSRDSHQHFAGRLTDTAQCKPCPEDRCPRGGRCIDSGRKCDCAAGWLGEPPDGSRFAADLCETQRPLRSWIWAPTALQAIHQTQVIPAQVRQDTRGAIAAYTWLRSQRGRQSVSQQRY